MPNNDPTTSYEAHVTAASTSPYEVTLDQDATINGLLIDSEPASVRHVSGQLSTLGTLNIQAGTFNLAGGALAQATVQTGTAGRLIVSEAEGRMDDVELLCDLRTTAPLTCVDLVNRGTMDIRATYTHGKILTIAGEWANHGTLNINGYGVLALDGATGDLGIVNQYVHGNIDVYGTCSSSSILGINRPHGANIGLPFGSTLDNTGQTLHIGPTDDRWNATLGEEDRLHFYGGKLMGGTVAFTCGTAAMSSYGAYTNGLEGVCISGKGSLTTYSESGFYVGKGLHLDDAELHAIVGLNMQGDQAITGRGEIVTYGRKGIGSTAGTLTIGPEVTVRAAEGEDGGISGYAIVNAGTIAARGNWTKTLIGGAEPLTNTGVLEARDGGEVTIGVGAHSSGPCTNAGELIIGPGSEIGVGGYHGFELTAQSSLLVELGTVSPLLLCERTVSLGGELKVCLDDIYMPTVGDRFTVVRTGKGVSGEFDSVDKSLLPPGVDFDLDYGTELVTLTITAIPEPSVPCLLAGGAGLLWRRRRAAQVSKPHRRLRPPRRA